jgi:3'-phosphoadenosine 5'-phosphosulfate sulfotransferase (PAPS reductase)/FAD synthetase
MTPNLNIICCSGGNDSVALIQWAHETGLKDVVILYNNTGWAIPWWADRMESIENLCKKYGFRYAETKSIGFKDMVRTKKGFPMAAGPMQWCSDFLKTTPTNKWLLENDPKFQAIIYIGIRREESQNRVNHPRSIIADMRYQGRAMEFPLVAYKEMERDFLVDRSGLDILLHSSMECFPCINSNRSDFRHLAQYPSKIEELESLENEMGYTSKGKPRVMFRPYRHMGAVGIKEVVRWGLADRGKYEKQPA